MFTILGALIGIFIEIITPWSDIVMPPINQVLSDPSISSNLVLSSMINVLGIFANYLLIPLFGAAGGLFFLDKSS